MAAVQVDTHRYPPFPPVPAGVTIIPFADFTGFGPRIVRDGETFERDGLGIPTVVLAERSKSAGVSAGGDAGGGTGKKSKKKKAKAKAIAQPNAAPWYELWGTYGDHARYHDPFDSPMPPSARLVVATEEFESHYGIKNLQSVLPDVYHVFRILKIFIGAQDPKEGQKLGKGSAPADADIDEHMSDDDDFDGADDGVPYTVPPAEDTTVASVVDAEAEAAEDDDKPVDPLVLKAQRFTDDPEHGVKVFLSSYFHDQGFIYNAKRTTAAPHLLHHFLYFLSRTSVIAKSDLVKALDVVERSRVDLPGTKTLSSALPDKFARALVGVGAEGEGWGRVGVHVLDLGLAEGAARIDVPDEDAEGGGAREKYSKAAGEEDGKEDGSKAEEEDGDAETGRPAKRARTEAEETVVPETREADVQMESTEGGWGSSGGGGGGWGDKSGDGGWGVDASGGGGGWGDDDATATTAATATNSGFVHEPPPTLESVLGPLAPPSTVEEIRKTLRPGFAERSMRKLTSVTLPNTGADPDALPLATLTFAPWLDWKPSPNPTTDSNANADLEARHNAPTLVRPSPSEAAAAHDMEHDSITVLVSLEAGEAVQPYVGMGVWGTWVRVERVEDEKVQPAGGEVLVGEGEGGKVVKGMEGKWYVEDVMMVIPSYWANEE